MHKEQNDDILICGNWPFDGALTLRMVLRLIMFVLIYIFFHCYVDTVFHLSTFFYIALNKVAPVYGTKTERDDARQMISENKSLLSFVNVRVFILK